MKNKVGSEEITKYAVLFADVVGSTTLYEQIGDQKAKECIICVQEIMAGIVHNFEGVVVDTIGDEIMCLFTDPGLAVLAACETQEALEDQPWFRRNSCQCQNWPSLWFCYFGIWLYFWRYS